MQNRCLLLFSCPFCLDNGSINIVNLNSIEWIFSANVKHRNKDLNIDLIQCDICRFGSFQTLHSIIKTHLCGGLMLKWNEIRQFVINLWSVPQSNEVETDFNNAFKKKSNKNVDICIDLSLQTRLCSVVEASMATIVASKRLGRFWQVSLLIHSCVQQVGWWQRDIFRTLQRCLRLGADWVTQGHSLSCP